MLLIRRRATYANITATLALVFAMAGGAYAAGRYVITSTKQIKPSVLSTLHGKAGPAGAPGASGKTGPQGPAGPQGSPGTAGTNGTNGTSTNGTNGESVTNKNVEPGATCKEGGAEFKVGTGAATKACNGEKGVIHPGESLPSEASETGTWSFSAATGTFAGAPISFPIPLSTVQVCTGEPSHEHAICASNAHFIEEGGTPPAECPGSATDPKAEPGNLCVYTTLFSGTTSLTVPHFIDSGFSFGGIENEGVNRAGALLFFALAEGAAALAYGTWAVTAPKGT